MKTTEPPVCPYCGEESKLADSAEVYSKSYGMIWLCRPCHAWVGTHGNSKRHAPLGRLANAELREAKKAAHMAFDPLWRAKMQRYNLSKNQARKRAYLWLSEELDIPRSKCHIGMFDEQQCRRVVEICQPIVDQIAVGR